LVPVETVHENPWFAVRRRGDFFAVEYNQPQVAILPIVDNCRVVMVRVHRPLIADVTLELPAGGAKEGEKPAAAAARELAEETGIQITDLARFRQAIPASVTPRYPYLTYVYEVNLNQGEYGIRGAYDSEIQSVECLSFHEVVEMIVRGEIYLSLPMAVLCRYFLSNKVS